MTPTAKPVFIVGYGNVGKRVASHHIESGSVVRALVRRPIQVSEHMDPRIELYRGDLDEPETLPFDAIAGTLLYYFASPPRHGIVDTRLRALVDNLHAPPEKIVLISTTGVYGDCSGAWVDETREPRPGSDRARRRLDAEGTLQSYANSNKVPLVILRVAGIYGADRLPRKRLREQTPMPTAEDCGYTNRVHVEDLIEVCTRAMTRPSVAGIFNVSDGAPGTMREYFDLVADALGHPRLPVLAREQMEATVNAEMLSYLGESRRIDNAKLLRTLELTLRYPNLESGLADVRKETPGP